MTATVTWIDHPQAGPHTCCLQSKDGVTWQGYGEDLEILGLMPRVGIANRESRSPVRPFCRRDFPVRLTGRGAHGASLWPADLLP
jgi:hypothetical protein